MSGTSRPVVVDIDIRFRLTAGVPDVRLECVDLGDHRARIVLHISDPTKHERLAEQVREGAAEGIARFTKTPPSPTTEQQIDQACRDVERSLAAMTKEDHPAARDGAAAASAEAPVLNTTEMVRLARTIGEAVRAVTPAMVQREQERARAITSAFLAAISPIHLTREQRKSITDALIASFNDDEPPDMGVPATTS